ncbi:MAG: NYN domain-containing protein [Phormidesmis priestleyi]|uniref:NYN domain-containing protein n=1 Tax=Phormidesmis priestleyi TaxID=268141 RepID=A0A2W4XVL9_9CYAN|nr:MAG: NYN domain-containing protein [Phormidesmis priestleyi]
MGQPISQSAGQPISQSIGQSSDRIAIFIDGSNLFYAASQLNIEVDYRRLLTTLVRGRRLLRAYFYTGVDPQNEKQRGFLLWLNRHGHRVVSKELAQLPDGSRKANMHVEMAVDMMRISEYCSTLTLLGGDGNLSYALQVLSQRGTSIEVVSLQSMTSDSLIDLADAYTDLADLREEIKR